MSDNELDAIVVRALTRLPSEAPGRAFAGRVMARVQLPPARPVRAYRRAKAWITRPGRATSLAAGYAALASIALFVAFSLLLANGPAIGPGLDWFVARAGTLLRDAGLGVAAWAVSSGLAGLVESARVSGPRLWLGAGLLTAGYAGCAVGLHVLLRAPRGTDAAAKLSA